MKFLSARGLAQLPQLEGSDPGKSGTFSRKSPLHFELWGKVVKAFGKFQAEAVEQGGLSGFGAHHAANAQLTARLIGQRQDHVRTLDAAQLLEDGARTVAQAGARLPLLQGLPQDIGQEGRPGCEPQRGFAFDARWDEWKGRVCESGK